MRQCAQGALLRHRNREKVPVICVCACGRAVGRARGAPFTHIAPDAGVAAMQCTPAPEARATSVHCSCWLITVCVHVVLGVCCMRVRVHWSYLCAHGSPGPRAELAENTDVYSTLATIAMGNTF